MDIKETSEALLKLDMKEKDVETAAFLGQWIVLLDSSVLSKATKINYAPKPPPEKSKGIFYLPEDDEYLIYVEGLYARTLSEEAIPLCVGIKHQEKWYFPARQNERIFTPEETLIAIAAHEVRHRLQYIVEIELFQPIKDPSCFPPPFGWIIYFVSSLKKHEPVTSTIHLPKEFDARVIEYTVLHFFRYLNTPNELVSLLLLEPSKLRQR